MTPNLMSVMSANQWLELAAHIQQVQETTGHGEITLTIAKGHPSIIGVTFTSKMPMPKTEAVDLPQGVE